MRKDSIKKYFCSGLIFTKVGKMVFFGKVRAILWMISQQNNYYQKRYGASYQMIITFKSIHDSFCLNIFLTFDMVHLQIYHTSQLQISAVVPLISCIVLQSFRKYSISKIAWLSMDELSVNLAQRSSIEEKC